MHLCRNIDWRFTMIRDREAYARLCEREQRDALRVRSIAPGAWPARWASPPRGSAGPDLENVENFEARCAPARGVRCVGVPTAVRGTPGRGDGERGDGERGGDG